MTRSECKQKLIDLGIAEPTEEQVTAYLDSVTAETKKEKDKADKLKEQADKATELQKQLDEINEKGLSEAEKANKALEEANKKITELTSHSFKAEAKAILSKAGLEDADVDVLIPGMVSGLEKVEDVQARANAYVGAISKIRENAIKEREKKDLDGTGTPGGNPGGDDKKTEATKYAETMVKTNSSESKGSDAIIGNYK